MTVAVEDERSRAALQSIPFEAKEAQQLTWAVGVWNEATGGELPLSPRLFQFNVREDLGIVRRGRIAMVDDQPAGFVLCSAYPGAPQAMQSDALGWVEAIAVAPAFQRQGIGRRLLDWAENWLALQDAGRAWLPGSVASQRLVHVGGGLRPFAPGPLADSVGEQFFVACGYAYADEPYGWDVARSLREYLPPAMAEVAAKARPGQPGQERQLLAFLGKEFPGRWTWQAERFLEEGGRISDYMMLWTPEGVQGACRLTFEDSVNPIDRFYPYGLPRPWGQLGSIGVSAHLRGQGLGLALLDAGLRRLHDSGINGCVIDWTTLLDFYAKCGFRPYRKWAQLQRAVVG